MKNKTFLRAVAVVVIATLSLSFFSSCEDNKDEITYYNTYIDGYIKDYHTGEPVAGVIFDAMYFDESNGGLFGTAPYYATKIAVSDANGYYKIKVPKNGDLRSRNLYFTFYGLRVTPRATENYNFEFKSFNYKNDRVNVENKRVDIRPITYGYLKVILPKSSSSNWGIQGYYQSTYEVPFYRHKLVSSGEYNETLKYFFFKVCALGGWINCGNHPTINRNFSMQNPKDTVILNVEE
jgi:hypothetical protein